MQADLTGNIKAIVLPEGGEKPEKAGQRLIYRIGKDMAATNRIGNSELLGVIEGGEIPEELASEILRGIIYGSSSDRAQVKFMLENKGIDLSKTIVIIKTK